MTAETARIRGQVAKILSTRELVLNRGLDHGVTVGMRFAVLDEAAEIVDPETKQSLGTLPRAKARVEAIRVEQKFAVLRTYHSRRVNVGGAGAGRNPFGPLLDPPRYVTRYDTFKATDAAWEPLSESESFVKVGDPVEQVFEKEEDDRLPT